MEIATPPTSKCIIYWKRKVKSEYMRLRQLKRFQANMGAKVRTGQQRLSLEGVSEMLHFSLWCWGSCRVGAAPSESISCIFAASWVSWRRCCFSSRSVISCVLPVPVVHRSPLAECWLQLGNSFPLVCSSLSLLEPPRCCRAQGTSSGAPLLGGWVWQRSAGTRSDRSEAAACRVDFQHRFVPMLSSIRIPSNEVVSWKCSALRTCDT